MKTLSKIFIGIIIFMVIISLAFLIFYSPEDFSNNSKNSNQTQGAKKNWIAIKDASFIPENLEIKRGESVTWLNQDKIQHVISADQEEAKVPRFLSSNLNKGDSFTFTFDSLGTYKYHCNINPNIKGKIIVK